MNNDQYSQIINWQLGSICCRVLRLGSSTGGLGLCQRLPDGPPNRLPCQQQLRHSAQASNKPHLAEKKYFGLTSNLAHLGRIC